MLRLEEAHRHHNLSLLSSHAPENTYTDNVTVSGLFLHGFYFISTSLNSNTSDHSVFNGYGWRLRVN